jgi:hypothetical protein
MTVAEGTSLAQLSAFLVKLEEAQIHYQMTSVRDGAVMVQVAVPGERWEIEFFPDSPPEVEVFHTGGVVTGKEMLDRLLAEHGD